MSVLRRMVGSLWLLGLIPTLAPTVFMPSTAFAHHSFAMYDQTKLISLVGTVKEFQWTNPHVILWLVKEAEAGKPAQPAQEEELWTIELPTSTGNLARMDWSKHSLVPGDRVTVELNPLRDGHHGGSFKKATIAATGKVLVASVPAPPDAGAPDAAVAPVQASTPTPAQAPAKPATDANHGCAAVGVGQTHSTLALVSWLALGFVMVLYRRQFVVGGAAALALGACSANGSKRETASSAATGAPRKGGHLMFAFDGTSLPAFVLDPHNSGFAPHNRVMRSLYDSVTRLLPDQSVGPWLAESWTISSDRTEYVFKLRTGITFHDGTVFDAAALKANFDRLANAKLALQSRNSLGPYAHSEVLAADQLKVTLTEPFTPFLRNLSMTKLAIVSPTAVAKHGPNFATQPCGTGPFRFVSAKQGSEILVERNPDYHWGYQTDGSTGPAYLDQITFVNVPEESTRIAVLQNGQVHAADLIPPQHFATIKGDPNFQLLEKELLNTNYALSLNVTRAPWDDDEMRLAAKLSLDLDTIVRVIYLGNVARAWSVLSPSMFGSAEQPLTHAWKADAARARSIVESKGWTPGADGIRTRDGKRLEIKFVDTQGNREKRLDLLQLVRRQLAATGIALSIETQPMGMYQAKLANNDYDLTAGASFHADPDILRQSYVPEVRSLLAGNRVNDPELIGWLKQAAREPEGPTRSEYYLKVQRKISEKTYAIPVYVLLYNLATSKRAHGISFDVHGFPEFHSAWLAA